MNQISELPEPMLAGLEFNYAAWTPGTVIMLCSVPWNADYRDVVRFSDQSALDTYLNESPGPKMTMTGFAYLNPGEPIRIELPLNSVYQYNYLRVFNPSQPVTGDVPKSFYYFINEPRRLATNTTSLSIQLDVFQTFGYGVTFGNCYIERGHIGIANENAFDNFGRDYLTIPEGLDIGGEYVINQSSRMSIASARDDFVEGTGEVIHVTTDIMVLSATDLEAPPGTVESPNLKTGPGSRMNNLPNGATIYLFNSVQWDKFLTEFGDKPWITAGIFSITAVPSGNPFGYPTVSATIDMEAPGEFISAQRFIEGSPERQKTSLPPTIAWRDTVELGRYSALKKMLVYPYCVVELTTYTGTPIIIKPESWNDPDGSVVIVPFFAPPNPRIMFYPYRYNAGDTTPEIDALGVVHDGGEFLDMATGIMNLPTFSVVNDGYMQFLAGNANSIAFQNSSAEWSQQKSLTGAVNQYDQANSGIGASKDINQTGITATNQAKTLANETAGYNAIMGAANNLMSTKKGGWGVMGGLANTAADYAIGVNQNNQTAGINNTASANVNAAQNKNAGFMRDSNRDFAEYAAKGDYANTIAGIQARVQDARLTQPTTAGQIGGDAFLLANFQWGYDFKVKTMGGASRAAVGELWLRYGYAVERFATMPASLKVMEKFTYWKLKETYITGASCPENYKQALRGIFEKGVTVWSNPADIGNIDLADNAPLEGITL